MKNELAIMAIKGGRFSDAESLFANDLTANPTSDSYFGLGICKLNMLLDINRSVEETAYCFEKALNLVEEDSIEDFKLKANEYLKSVLAQYKSVYIQLEDQKKSEATAAAVGALLTVGAAVIGSSGNSNAFTQIASLAAAGAGVGIAVDGLQNLGKIPEMQKYIIQIGEDLINNFERLGFCTREDLLLQFNSSELLAITTQIKEENKEQGDRTMHIVAAIFGVYRIFVKKKFVSGILLLLTAGGYGIWWAYDLYRVVKKGGFEPKW